MLLQLQPVRLYESMEAWKKEAEAGLLDLDEPFAVKGIQSIVRARFQAAVRPNVDYFEATIAAKAGAGPFLRGRAFPEHMADICEMLSQFVLILER